MMDDIWTRIVSDLAERVSGPLKFRLVLQPLMAAFLAARSGMADAKAGRPPYFWTLVSEPSQRARLIKDGLKSVGKVFVLAFVLDVVYQIIATRFVYPGEAAIVAILLAIVPYVLVRGLVTRLARSHDMRPVLIIVGATIAVLGLASIPIPANGFRPTIERTASAVIGRPVDVGRVRLSMLGRSLLVDAVAIADDPAFSTSPFLKARSMTVDVELLPLIAFRSLNVRGITIEDPEVALIRNSAGHWNVSSLSPTGGSLMRKFDVREGRLTVTSASGTSQYEHVNIGASHMSPGSTWPLIATAVLPGGALNLKVNVASRVGGVSVDGRATVSNAVLVDGGSPASQPVVVDFRTSYDFRQRLGNLHHSTIRTGGATAQIDGIYRAGDTTLVNFRISTAGMPAKELESFLPALGMQLPRGTRLTAGNVVANLAVTGATRRITTTGTVGLFDARFTGLDLGSKVGAVAGLAGVDTGRDLDVQELTANLLIAPDGVRFDHLTGVVPSFGRLTGAGTIDAKNNLHFAMVATLTSPPERPGGPVGTSGVVGGEPRRVPFLVQGTATDPRFVPDAGEGALSPCAATRRSRDRPGIGSGSGGSPGHRPIVLTDGIAAELGGNGGSPGAAYLIACLHPIDDRHQRTDSARGSGVDVRGQARWVSGAAAEGCRPCAAPIAK
jgi:AsmA protein